MLEILGGIIWIGVGATLLIDLWALLQRVVLKWPTLDYALVGRWIGHMPKQFVHDNIRNAQPTRGETPIGWIIHYAIGIAYAALLFAIMGAGWLEHPTLIPALAIGIATIVAPFFLMQPCLGFGTASSRTPNPSLARVRALITHTLFGIGMYLAALLLAMLR
jgi:hypothetical protein